MRSRTAVFAFAQSLVFATLCAGAVPTTTALSTSSNSSTLGQSVTLTATIAPFPGSGKVTFFDGVTVLGTSTVTGSAAMLTTGMLPAGVHSLHAVFLGNGSFAASTSAAVPMTVNALTANSFQQVGPSASSLAPGTFVASDFNGDGKVDLAGSDGLVLLGNGDGTFKSSNSLGLGINFSAAVDLNGDGKVDLVAWSSPKIGGIVSGTVSVLLGNGDGTFVAPTTYQLGSGLIPASVVVADFNGDGKPDVAVGTSTGIFVLLGNGDGTLQTPVSMPGASNVAVGDFNGDGKTDLVSSDAANGVRVFLGNGDGTFQAAIPSSSGGGPLVVADFNGDGKADLAVGVGSSVNVLFGNGDGTFGPPVNYAVGATVNSISLGDFNGDGKLDLAVAGTADAPSNSITILYGNGAGSFQVASSFVTSYSDFAVAADLNGDGRTDLAALTINVGGTRDVSGLLGRVATASSVSLTSSLNPASFGQNVSLIATVSPSAATGSIALYDGANLLATMALSGGQAAFSFNQLVVGTHSLVAVYSGDSTNSISASPNLVETIDKLASSTTLAAVPNPATFGQSVTITATVPNATGQVSFFDGPTPLGTGTLSGGVASFVALSLAVGSHSLTATYAGDPNHAASSSPAVTEVVTQGAGTAISLASSVNPATLGQNLTLTATVSPSTATGSVAFYDGATVIGTKNLASGKATLTTNLLATGMHSLKARYGGDASNSQAVSGSFTQTIGSLPSFGLLPPTSYLAGGDQVLVADFNGDGNADLLTADHNRATVSVLLGNGNGTFQTPKSMSIQGQPNSPTFVTTGDINGDGKTDLVVSYGNQIGVWFGNGDGTFQAAVYTAVPSTCAAVGDFNVDGKPDAAVCSGGFSMGVVFGGGDGTFQGGANYSSGGVFPTAISAGDLNGDGKADLVVLSSSLSLLTVFLGNGDGTFQSGIAYAPGSNPSSVAIGDLNGDGKPELVVGTGSGSINVLVNNGDGSFQRYVSYNGGPTTPNPSVVIGDLNGDGKADVAVGGNGINVLLGNGDGTLQPLVNFDAGVGFTTIALGDFNGDGRMDVAASASGTNVNVLLGSSATQLTFSTQPMSTGSSVGSVVVQPVNGSGIAVAGYSSVPVTLTSTPAGVNATATTSNGVAMFTNLTFPSPGTYTVTASSPGLTSVTSNSFVISSGAAPPTVVIDTPSAGTAASGSLVVSGWALDTLSAISNVKVMVDGVFAGNASYGMSRLDVCVVYPGRPGCPNVGYAYVLNTNGLSTGAHTITVVATDSDATPDSGSASVTFMVSNIPPSIHIDGPMPGSVVSGVVTVSGWAIDNTTLVGTAIAGVQIKIDGTVVGNATYGASRPDVCTAFPGRAGCPNVGFSYSLNTANLSAGSHVITAIATDMDSNANPDFGSTSVTVTVAVTPPTVYIDTPSAGAVLAGTATVSGWAIDSGTAIASVAIKVDGTVVGNATYGSSRPDVCAAFPGRISCPNVGFTYALDTSKLTPGVHMLTALATDSDGTPDSGSWTVAIQVSPQPTVFIDTPSAGTTISGTVTVSGWAIDNTTAIGSVQIKVDGVAVGSATYGSARPDVCAVFAGRPGCPNVGFSYQLNTSNLSQGTHTITAVATDTDGIPDSGSYTVTVTVGPSLPTVYVDSLAPGATVSGTVAVSGWAVASSTFISSVQVKVDGAVVGTATYGTPRPDVCAVYQGRPGCPNVGFTYPLNASALSSGSHTITVTAADMSGNSGSYSLTVVR